MVCSSFGTLRTGLVLLGVLAISELARADTWQATADLANARKEHTATLLASNQVLVVGGRNDGELVASAEVYQVDRNEWRFAHAPNVVRADHSATLLPSGKVLVVGGQGTAGHLASAELYDPATDTWSPAGNLSFARARHTATLLASGKVAIIGGMAKAALASLELYDPATNAWSTAASMATPRYDHAVSLLPTGEVLVTGGYEGQSMAATSAEIFDPGTGAWRTAANPAMARPSHSTTLLPSGLVFAVGGEYANGAETYDPAMDAWSTAGSPMHARAFHTATLLPSGKLLVTGGIENDESTASAELYDAARDTWAAAAPLGNGRSLHTATLLPTGRVLVTGGESDGAALASTEIYVPNLGAWTLAGNLATTHAMNHLTLLPSGKVLLIAGTRNGFASATAEQYDVATNSWSAAGSLGTARVSATATLLLSGKILVAGGYTGSNYLATVEIYDPISYTSGAAASLATTREYHTATLLPSGKVLIAGGFNGDYLAGVEIYDPENDTWATAANLAHARGMHTATLLPSGRVLVAGGTGNGTSGVLDAEIYEPASDSWSPAGQLSLGRYFHTATLLASGKVLVAGGRGPGYRAIAELYDAEANAWSSAGSLENMRFHHASALLPTGEVLVVGGSDNDPIESTERYDPTTNTWSPAGDLSVPRRSPSAVVLPTGDVLVAGGRNYSNSLGLATSERLSMRIELDENRRPVAAAPNEPLLPGDMLALSGQNFTGDSEASGGGTRASPTNSPLVQLQRIDNGQVAWSPPAPNSNRSSTSYLGAALPGLPGGHYTLTMIVNGIPGLSQVVEVAPTHAVTPSTNGLGEIAPESSQFVATGAASTFALTPHEHHHVTGVSGSCGGTIAGTQFTTAPIVADCTVIAEFAIDTFTLGYSASAHGTIVGESLQSVNYGGDGTPVSAVPDAGHSFVRWDDGSIANPRIDLDVTANVNVEASFAINTYTLTYSAGPGGLLSGAVEQHVEYGGSGSPVTAVPDTGHHFEQWSDGSANNPRTDEDVSANIGVTAMFALDSLTVMATASSNGTITPSTQDVGYGGTATFTVTPDAGYYATVSGDTCDATQVDDLHWSSGPITTNCTVSATFDRLPTAALTIDVTDNRDHAGYGDVLEYVVTLSNIGTGDAANVSLTGELPDQIDAAGTTWTCTGSGDGAVCQEKGTGTLDTDGIILPAGRTLLWHILAPVRIDAVGATIAYSTSAGLDNTSVAATDTDILVIFRNGFD